MDATDEIRTLLEKRIEALEQHDAASANASLDPDIVAFEIAGPLQLPPDQATDPAITEAWLDTFDEGPFVSMEQLMIRVDGAVAYCHSLNRLRGRAKDGREIDVTMRSTLGLRRAQNGWLVEHGHTSLPR